MSISTDVHQETIHRIGEVAGTVWGHLATEGPMSLAKLVKETGEKRELVLQAIGWLARENKLYFFEQGRSKLVGLIDQATNHEHP